VPGVGVMWGYDVYIRAATARGSFVPLSCTQDDRHRKKNREKEEKGGGFAAPFFFSSPTPALSS